MTPNITQKRVISPSINTETDVHSTNLQINQLPLLDNQDLTNQTARSSSPSIYQTNIRLARYRTAFKFNDGTKSHPLSILIIILIIAVAIFTDILGFFSALIAIAVVFSINHWYEIYLRKKRLKHIIETTFPANIWRSEGLRDLELTSENKQLISEGLRDFFILRVKHAKKPTAMPSKYIDKLWHAFILDTRGYENYCKKAFGKTLHHVPDYEFIDHQNSIKMHTYQSVCRLQGIEPARPNNTLPRLFGTDIYIEYALGIISAEVFETSVEALVQDLTTNYQVWHSRIMTTVGGKGEGFDKDAEIDMDGDASCSSGVSCGSDGCGSCGGSCGSGCGSD